MSSFVDSEERNDIPQLRDQLNSNYADERKEAARRVISRMRSGENVQDLFSDMLRCARTDDLELKKLVYLYLVNYSSQEPEQAIMAVNTFVQDSMVDNPLIRALAVRTMCRIKLESVAEHMIVPLKKCLKDDDPYVRKTAAFGVSKLYEVIPEAVENAGIFNDLIALLHDENPLVVSNTTAALFEINEIRTQPVLKLNQDNLSPILAALPSSSEWCQIMLLDALAKYNPVSMEDAEFLVDRLIPMLKNSNPAVVVGAFKCIFLFMEKDRRNPSDLFPIIIPPFITLVASAEFEIQYLVLRTLSLFVLKYPRALAKEIRVFFCKYNDPSYVKMEKLDIIVTVCNEMTAQAVLEELNEYCNAVDVAFVKKAVRCIGQIAIKVNNAAPRCVDILVGLVEGKAEYATEEAIVVMSDILRRFPGSYESVIAAICKNLEQIHETSARAAAIWILGEYCHIITDVDLVLDPFIDTFHDEQPSVQLQILTAFIKVFLYQPDKTHDQLQFILNEATKGTVNPDVRNRAFIYWRLLSTSTDTAKMIVKFSKTAVHHSGVQYDDAVLSELIKNMGSVAGVLHIVPSDFVHKTCYEADVDFLGDEFSEHNWQRIQFTQPNVPIELYTDWETTSMYVRIVNQIPQPLSDLAIAVNKNPIGLAFAGAPEFPPSVKTGESIEIEIPITFRNDRMGNFENGLIDIALKTNFGTLFGRTMIPAVSITLEAGRIEGDEFRRGWARIPTTTYVDIGQGRVATDNVLRSRKIFIHGRNQNRIYASLMIPPNTLVFLEIIEESARTTVNFKSSDENQINYIKLNLPSLLQSS